MANKEAINVADKAFKRGDKVRFVTVGCAGPVAARPGVVTGSTETGFVKVKEDGTKKTYSVRPGNLTRVK